MTEEEETQDPDDTEEEGMVDDVAGHLLVESSEMAEGIDEDSMIEGAAEMVEGIDEDSMIEGAPPGMAPDPFRQQCDLLFREVDLNGDGLLTKRELKKGIDAIRYSTGLTYTAKQIFKTANTRGSKKIDPDEFYEFMLNAIAEAPPIVSEEIVEAGVDQETGIEDQETGIEDQETGDDDESSDFSPELGGTDEEDSSAGMLGEATMRIHQLMRSTSEAASAAIGELSELDNRSLVDTEFEVQQAKMMLQDQRIMTANRSLSKAESNLGAIEDDVQRLRRAIALLHRLLRDPSILRQDLERILNGLRNATGAAELGEVAMAAAEVEYLVDDLVGETTSNLNPFLFRNFWFSISTQWPPGGDKGIMIVNMLNDSQKPLPTMRLAPPVPGGWSVDPEWVDIPRLPPNGYLFLKFDIRPGVRAENDDILNRKLSVATGYRVRQGKVTISIRAENKGLEDLHNVLIAPWLPPSFITPMLPRIRHLPAGGTAHIRMPIAIDFGQGRSMMV